ncbi:methionyl-tRNA formyltransferase [Alkalicoccus halolimnae]|uniref:Methionyl-tRNA formyltransferase n=1 Tax=Alkalicoccus halolimnae TaxID=1667239 RepID=A0A5C7FD24_9BACI|nr:methionyl-tRNA formyltransferase [Alkalicoccus halolimnae]TXF87390.1 methionyl-tRNA formyltransferase [Alkalicoccus halolimnae]
MNIVFMGTPDFAVPILEAILEEGHHVSLAVTQPDRPKGRKKTLTPPPVKAAAEKHNLPVFQPEKIKNDYLPVIEARPDLIVTAAFGQILPDEVLELPEYGAINVHASLLPKYRGGAPIHQAVIDGEPETGITIMYMVQKLDAGDMLMKRALPITEKDTTGTMHDKLSLLGAQMIKEILPLIKEGSVYPEKQNVEEVSFAPNITKEMELINWEQSAVKISNLIRGLNPWPVAYTTFAGIRFKIWEAEPLEQNTDAAPGTVVKAEGKELHVACGNGSILALLRVQPSGKKPMDIATFRNSAGKELVNGAVLGSNE